MLEASQSIVFLHPAVLICNRAIELHHVQCLFQQKFLQLYESSGSFIIRRRTSAFPFSVIFFQGSMSGRTEQGNVGRCLLNSKMDFVSQWVDGI